MIVSTKKSIRIVKVLTRLSRHTHHNTYYGVCKVLLHLSKFFSLKNFI